MNTLVFRCGQMTCCTSQFLSSTTCLWADLQLVGQITMDKLVWGTGRTKMEPVKRLKTTRSNQTSLLLSYSLSTSSISSLPHYPPSFPFLSLSFRFSFPPHPSHSRPPPPPVPSPPPPRHRITSNIYAVGTGADCSNTHITVSRFVKVCVCVCLLFIYSVVFSLGGDHQHVSQH